MNDGLKPEHRQAIIDTLASNPSVERIVLFGSRAMGAFTPTSDVDLVLFGDDLTLSDQAALAEAVAELPIAQRVDILIHHRIEHEALRAHIRKHGVEWFARKTSATQGAGMADEWRKYDVSVLIDSGSLVIGDGYRAKNEELAPSGLPFARVGNINNGFQFENADYFPVANLPRVGNKISQSGDVVFTSKGTVGRFAFVRPSTPQFVYSPQLCFWRSMDKSLIDPRFLYFWMHGREFFVQFKGVAGQTDMAEYVSLSDQRRMQITLPPLSEQRAIAHILGALDDKIELNRRMSATLEAMARALFKAWFVDFEPVRAKMEGRWRRGESLPGLPAHLYDLFPDRLVDSELGEMPEGWEVAALGSLSSLNPEVWTRQTRPPEINYVDLSSTKWGRIEVVTTYQASDAPSRAQRVLRVGDTIVGTVRPGNGSYALISESGLTGSTGFAVLRPRSEQYVEFVYLAATAADNIEALAHLADGAAYPAVRPEVVAATPISRPNDEVLVQFSRGVAPLLAKIARSDRESRTLAGLRDALLPRLISGALRVKDAEKFLQEREL